MNEINQKSNTLIDEEFLKLIESDIERQQAEWEKWKMKYTWDMNNQRFISRLDQIVDKVFDLIINDYDYGYYSVSSDEDNEDYDYLISLENYLIDYAQKHDIPIDFFSDDAFVSSTIPFKYYNKLYILEHGHGQGSYMSISYVKKDEVNKINSKKIINLMEGN